MSPGPDHGRPGQAAAAARAHRLAARATGAGVGLVALMLTWLVGSRLVALVWPPPLGPTAALVAAQVVGLGTGVAVGARLARGLRRPE